MKHLTKTIAIGALASATIIYSGCERAGDRSKAASTERATKPTPEESFDQIVETFRRGMENIEIGFVARGEDGHSMMSGSNKVFHKLVPPQKDGELYKGVITVVSESRYSIQRSGSPDEKEEERDDSDSGFDSANDPLAPQGVDAFDSDLAGNPDSSVNRSKKQSGLEKDGPVVDRQTDEQERNYELIYKDGKWTLITQLDPETEQSVKNAFDHALATQI